MFFSRNKKVAQKNKDNKYPEKVEARQNFIKIGKRENNKTRLSLRKKFSGNIKKFSPTSGNKYGLIVGDEGAILIYMVDNTVKSRNFIAQANADNLREFETILAKDKNAPIFLIIDSMDQSFSQQTLPPISPFGVKKLIKRRLDRELGSDIIKGYIILERDEGGRRDWNYLTVALENSPYLKLWIDFVDNLDNRLSGIYLLSVEAENIVKNIDLTIKTPENKNAESAAKWKLFISHNKVGGFRQVVLKNGRIMFTRLTQPVTDESCEAVAGSVEQEITSTIEYIRRLSFDFQQGMDVYIIASSDINNCLDMNMINFSNVYKFTPHEISDLFGISGATQPSDQFGDVILSAFISCSKTHRLTLSFQNSLKINRFYRAIKYQRIGVALLLILMLFYSAIIAVDVWGKYSQIEMLEQKKNVQQRKLDDLNSEIKKSGMDVRKISDTVFLYNKINEQSENPAALLSKFRSVIIPAVSIKEVSWDSGKSDTGINSLTGGSNEGKKETITIALNFPEISNTKESFEVVAKKILSDMQSEFPEYKIDYIKLPEVFSEKAKSGEIKFDDNNSIEIPKENLDATLSLVRQSSLPIVPAASPPVSDAR